MPSTTTALQLTIPAGDSPLYTRIARAISDQIESGRLPGGTSLPSSRNLARRLGVHRNTVVAAFDELKAQALLETRRGAGTFVVESDHQDAPRRQRREPKIAPTFSMPAPREAVPIRPDLPAGALILTGGTPDPRLFPAALLARAYRRTLNRRASELLDYGSPLGTLTLRKALVDMLRSLRGIRTTPEQVLVTRGSQMAVWLAARTLVRPGDHIAVESFGYPPAFAALRQHGATLHPIDVDQRGIRIDALEELLKKQTIQAVYVTPHHQWPTMATLSGPRRQRLIELAERHRFAILEDDYDYEYHYDGQPVLPLASSGHPNVVYLGTMSKVLAPGLRIGYLVSSAQLVTEAAEHRVLIDRQGDQPTEAAVADLLEDGELGRHIRKTRREYRARRDALVQALRESLGGVLTLETPRGGMATWCRVVDDVDVGEWAACCRAAGVWFTPASYCTVGGHSAPYIRVGFARVNIAEIERAVQIMVQQLPGRRP